MSTMDGPIFDCHARLGPTAVTDLLATMDTYGIARAAVAAGGVVDLDVLARQLSEGGHVRSGADNERVRVACAGSGGRLVPVYFANPHADVAAYRAEGPAFRMLELSPAVHGVGYADPRTVALVRVAADLAHPVYTVCTGRPGCRAADLVALAARFPAVRFVFGHCGFTGLDTHGINQLEAQPNVLVETSGSLSVAARHALHRLGPHRVLFGTGYPLQHPSVELAKFAALRPDHATWRRVAWHNAHRLLAEEST
jgi:predicted TIM-barrel fold metal-dependent hydrolase